MSIQFEFTPGENLLEVKAWGYDETVEDSNRYSEAVIREAIKCGVTRVLCDEREVEYRLNLFDTYIMAETVAQTAPNVTKVAIVCDPGYLEDGKFYETVLANRGIAVSVTDNMKQARAWLG